MKYTFKCQHCHVDTESSKPLKIKKDKSVEEMNKKLVEDHLKHKEEVEKIYEEMKESYKEYLDALEKYKYEWVCKKKYFWSKPVCVQKEREDVDNFLYKNLREIWGKQFDDPIHPPFIIGPWLNQTNYIECPICKLKNYIK